MRLSDQPEYLAAIPAMYEGDYVTARRNLRAVLSRAEAEADTLTASYLLQLLGDTEARSGDKALAHTLHGKALSLDPVNPHSLLIYARSLFSAFREPALAQLRIAEVESLIQSPTWVPDGDDPDRAWYQQECKKLRASIHACSPNNSFKSDGYAAA